MSADWQAERMEGREQKEDNVSLWNSHMHWREVESHLRSSICPRDVVGVIFGIDWRWSLPMWLRQRYHPEEIQHGEGDAEFWLSLWLTPWPLNDVLYPLVLSWIHSTNIRQPRTWARLTQALGMGQEIIVPHFHPSRAYMLVGETDIKKVIK